MSNEDQASAKDLLFLQTIAMFQAAAMQQLGKIADPVSGKVSKHLDQARMTIDTLEVLQEKTSGNLTGDEASFLEKVLFELRMNYMDELKKPEEEGSPDETEGDEENG